MQAILTSYLGVTNTKPRRIKVEAGGGGKRIYSHSSLENECEEKKLPINDENIHKLAAKRLAEDFWAADDIPMVGGGTKNGFAFVFVPCLKYKKIG